MPPAWVECCCDAASPTLKTISTEPRQASNISARLGRGFASLKKGTQFQSVKEIIRVAAGWAEPAADRSKAEDHGGKIIGAEERADAHL